MKLEAAPEHFIEKASGFLKENNVDQETITLFALSLDELLYSFQSAGHFESCKLRCAAHRKQLRITLVVPGEPLNPLESTDSPILQKSLQSLDRRLEWRYRRGQNEILYTVYQSGSAKQALNFVREQLDGEHRTLAKAIIFNLLTIIMGAVFPVLSAKVIYSFTSNQLERVIYTITAIVLIQLLYNLFLCLQTRLYTRVYMGIMQSASQKLSEKLLNIRISALQRHGSGIFIRRITEDTYQLTKLVANIFTMFGELLLNLGIMFAIAWVSPIMFAYQVAAILIQTIIEAVRARILRRDDSRVRLSYDDYTGLVSNTVQMSKEIKLYSGKTFFQNLLGRKNREVADLKIKMENHNANYKMLRWDLRDIFDWGFRGLLVLLVFQKKLDVTMAVVLFNYNVQLFGAVHVFGYMSELFTSYSLTCERLIQMLSGRDFPDEHFGQKHVDRLQGEIELKNVSFSYGSVRERAPYILRNTNLHAGPGECVVITGKSGCGKSTTFSLIAKLLDVSSGAVVLDGINIKELDEDTIRKNIAIVPQNPHLLHATIRDNLRLAKPDASEDDLVRACQWACIHDDISAMVHGYDTLIAEGGKNLSGGQLQRISIAMAFLKDAPILLMDEATSALEDKTQMNIQERIAVWGKNRTILMITHNPDIIMNADRILFMENGQVTADGTHAELLATCQGYRELLGETMHE